MGGAVDPPGEARDDDPALLPEFPRHGLGQEPAIGRGIARPDHGDGAARQQLDLAEGQKQGRGVIGFGEHRGKSRVGHDQEPAAEAAELGQLALGCRGGADGQGPQASPAPRQLRQSLQGRLGAAEAAQQLAEGDGPDILAAPKAKAGQSLSVGKGRGGHA